MAPLKRRTRRAHRHDRGCKPTRQGDPQAYCGDGRRVHECMRENPHRRIPEFVVAEIEAKPRRRGIFRIRRRWRFRADGRCRRSRTRCWRGSSTSQRPVGRNEEV